MLEPVRHLLLLQKNILASTSVQRKALLERIDFNFEIVKPEFDENLDKSSFSHPCEYVKENAKQKALSVWKRLALDKRPADLVIGCDTVVTLNDEIYGKPKDSNDAIKMLTKLSGLTHTVFTGVALITSKSNPNQSSNPIDDYLVTTFHESTDVTMCEMTDSIIESYVKTGEPLGKAGSYGIQGIGSTLIESIRGDYFNVVGLPLHRFAKELYYIMTE
ncbi:putative bifunctional dTTP/UTP pyrophosphatase/methyltransferase protein [Sarcoptes scabiei]|uniref:N-acetylserotonin O-methyltransferase-like protein n=1 Tax=Sarcoptes scabiei TaxID=52283 RepID=A0A132AL54_SARSC|nr:putative bifunctional dTTP/UTP pyrophosphatase/methyltransferase protein [Sarcoptes scabiei]KPM11579.1 N-acetylserotonin O-methyltransferase-like protein [Sarcoptes scabiei]UXI17439.1 N-acetylated-alpha-linked acidic dipeptidase 2 [Sarcoptes scabiei]